MLENFCTEQKEHFAQLGTASMPEAKAGAPAAEETKLDEKTLLKAAKEAIGVG